MSTALDRRREHITALFPEWTERSLGDWLAFCAERYADRPLVITDDRTTTYAEVDAWATRLADGLVALGLKPGEHVGIVMANYTEFVPVKFAVARAGGVAVPMNFLYREEELKYVLGQSECRILITMTGYADMDYPQMLDNIVPGWDSGAVSEELPLLRDVILFSTDGRTRAGVRTIEDLDTLGRENAGATAGLDVDPRSLADILYTSGTTGSPKGVMIAHDAAQRTGYASALTRAFDDGWRVLFSLPCYHMFGYVEGLMAAMVVGGAVILQPKFDPAALPARYRTPPSHGHPVCPDDDRRDPRTSGPRQVRPVEPSGRSLRCCTRPRLAVGKGREGTRGVPRSSPGTE